MTILSTRGSKTVTFEPSISPDVTGYRMYYCLDGEELTNASPYLDIGNRTTFVLPDVLDPGITTLDGIYKVAMVAYDDEGNTSESGPEVIVPLDFRPPEPPGGIVVS